MVRIPGNYEIAPMTLALMEVGNGSLFSLSFCVKSDCRLLTHCHCSYSVQSSHRLTRRPDAIFLRVMFTAAWQNVQTQKIEIVEWTWKRVNDKICVEYFLARQLLLLWWWWWRLFWDADKWKGSKPHSRLNDSQPKAKNKEKNERECKWGRKIQRREREKKTYKRKIRWLPETIEENKGTFRRHCHTLYTAKAI